MKNNGITSESEEFYFEVTEADSPDRERGWYFYGAYEEEVGPYNSRAEAKKGLQYYLECL